MVQIKPEKPVVLAPGAGRAYDCGPMRAIFKADGTETGDRYSVSEWWLEPGTKGPGSHHHEENDEIFLVVAGTPRILVGTEWINAVAGTFFRIPAGVTHDFDNPGDTPACLFNIFIPDGFEENMPAIVEWYRNS